MATDQELEDRNALFSYGLHDEQIHEIEESLHEHDYNRVHALLGELSPADSADLLEKITKTDRDELLEKYADDFPADVFTELEPEVRQSILSRLPPREVARIVEELDSDDALDLIISLDENFTKEIIHDLSSNIRLALTEGMRFPEDSAGRMMQREFVAIPQFWTVGKTIDYLRAARDELPSEFFNIFVIAPDHHVVGKVPLSQILCSDRHTKIEALTLDETHPVPATMDQEDVAHLFRREDILSTPVIDEDERLIGVVTIDDIVDVIDEEAEEDFLKLAGVSQDDLYSAVLSTTGARFRWLFINLFTAILASVVISFFDTTIEELVALAVLMPIVASMGGNAGTQALTVAVRALATKELSGANSLRIIWKETLVGLLNGISFAIITGLLAGLWFQNPILGIVIGAAMIINLVVAGLSGAGIPVLLSKIGSDPAISSAVILTTLTDVIGFFAFLGLAALFLL